MSDAITIPQLGSIAVRAGADIRTVFNAYTGQGKPGKVRDRVARAARDLGYPEPPAASRKAEEGS